MYVLELVILYLFASSLHIIYFFCSCIFFLWHATEFVSFFESSQYHQSIKFSKQLNCNRFLLNFFYFFLSPNLFFLSLIFSLIKQKLHFVSLNFISSTFSSLPSYRIISQNYFCYYILYSIHIYAIVTQLIITKIVESIHKKKKFRFPINTLLLSDTTKSYENTSIECHKPTLNLKIEVKILIWKCICCNFVLNRNWMSL